jgi:hypothetical protein
MTDRQPRSAVTAAIAVVFTLFYGVLASSLVPASMHSDFLNLYTGASLARDGQFSQLHDPDVQFAREKELFPAVGFVWPFVRPHVYAAFLALSRLTVCQRLLRMDYNPCGSAAWMLDLGRETVRSGCTHTWVDVPPGCPGHCSRSGWRIHVGYPGLKLCSCHARIPVQERLDTRVGPVQVPPHPVISNLSFAPAGMADLCRIRCGFRRVFLC